MTSGNYRGAAIAFVDYWSGRGAWTALRPPVQAALTRWMPKAPLDFRALINEPTPVSAYARLPFSVLIMRGEHAPAPTRLIADTLSTVIPAARLAVVAGAGHMGPLTHASEVNAAIARHVTETDAVWIEPAIPALRGFECASPTTHAQGAKGLI